MLATDSSRKRVLAIGWLLVAGTNLWLIYTDPDEPFPDGLIWASFALVYGLASWSRLTTNVVFWVMTVATGVPMLMYAGSRSQFWSALWQIVWMGVLVYLLIWQVNRQRAAQTKILELGEAELSRAARRELTARFGSHQIRTRLSVARGFVEFIRDSTEEERTRTDAQLVVGELDKAAALNLRMLTLVQVELQTTPAPVEFFLDDLVEAVLHRWTPTADRAWSCDTSSAVMLGNPERLETALDCLVENAVKFTNDGDSIGIEAHVNRGHAVLSVSDSGMGIPPEEIDGVFDTFRTGSAHRGGARAGSGLGLAIVAAIVEDKNGSVEVTSVPGEGTRFTIRYPASPLGRLSDSLTFPDPPDTVQRSSVKKRPARGAVRMSAEASRVMMARVDGMGSSVLGRSWSRKRAGLPSVGREAGPVEGAIDRSEG